MPVTAEHLRIAARIDARIKQLDALGLLEVQILSEMADDMPGFHHLMVSTTGPEMDALCDEFAGFYRFAQILETLAHGIASGKIKVPGGRSVSEEERMAAAIDLRVRQLEAKGIGGAALLERMLGHVLDLQRIWSTSDESLAALCRQYPGLYRYGMLMEAAAEAESKKATTSYGHLPALPASVRATLAQLLTDGATLERGFQTVLDARGQPNQWVQIEVLEDHHERWTRSLAGLPGALRSADVPDESRALLRRILEPMAKRIDQLQRQVAAQRG